MTARKTPRKARPAATPATAVPTDIERQQFAVAGEGADAVRRGFDAIRKINDRAMQSALVHFTETAKRYGTPHQPQELLAIPTELLRWQIEQAARYWQELSSAALEMQAELFGCSSHLVDTDAAFRTASALAAFPRFPFFGFERLSAISGGSALP